VVPYRAREAHLRLFVPNLQLYFARDKFDRNVPYRLLVVEQEEGLPFNRGALKNIGFTLLKSECDYVCFHDVDYLPVWADYSSPDRPMPIAWHGPNVRPIAPGRSNQVTLADPNLFFGAVVLTPNDAFAQVNGYANDYWGWGYEDADLRLRFDSARILRGRREGTFRPLDHDNEGYNANGTASAASLANDKIFRTRWPLDQKYVAQPATLADGLSSLAFDILGRQSIADPKAERPAVCELVKVRIKAPSPPA
jgi:hypothetical protein